MPESKQDPTLSPDGLLQIVQVLSVLAFVAAWVCWSYLSYAGRTGLLVIGAALFAVPFVAPVADGPEDRRWPRRRSRSQPAAGHQGPIKLTDKSLRKLKTAGKLPANITVMIENRFVNAEFANADKLAKAFRDELGEQVVAPHLETILRHAEPVGTQASTPVQMQEAPPVH